MSYKRTNSKYTEQKNSAIRFNIIGALGELAKFRGVDINTIKTTSPYSYELSNVTSQKIAAEMKKLIDYGMVVKGVTKGQTVKYMLRSTYTELMNEGKLKSKEFGYGDYRDLQKEEDEDEEEKELKESEEICRRLISSQHKKKYPDMW